MSSEGRASCPNIDCDIKHSAVHDGHKLSLRLRILDVEPPQHAARRAREIILKKRHFYSRGRISLRLKGFEEKTSRIAKDLGLDNHDVWNFSWNNVHAGLSHRSNFSKRFYLLCIDYPV